MSLGAPPHHVHTRDRWRRHPVADADHVSMTRLRRGVRHHDAYVVAERDVVVLEHSLSVSSPVPQSSRTHAPTPMRDFPSVSRARRVPASAGVPRTRRSVIRRRIDSPGVRRRPVVCDGRRRHPAEVTLSELVFEPKCRGEDAWHRNRPSSGPKRRGTQRPVATERHLAATTVTHSTLRSG